MKQTTCEFMILKCLPVIRKEIAKSIIKNYKLNQKETAEILGVTPAAICQYISKKRGKYKINDPEIIKEIEVSATRIVKKGEKSITKEICRICRLFRKSSEFNLFCQLYDE